MAELRIEGQDVVVRLTPLEKLGAVSGDVRIPRSAIGDVRVVQRPFEEVRGLRAPGTGLPGVIALGTWRRRGRRKEFVAVRRGESGLVIELTDDFPTYGRLVISAADAEDVRASLTTA